MPKVFQKFDICYDLKADCFREFGSRKVFKLPKALRTLILEISPGDIWTVEVDKSRTHGSIIGVEEV